jgi:hypothetical protein
MKFLFEDGIFQTLDFLEVELLLNFGVFLVGFPKFWSFLGTVLKIHQLNYRVPLPHWCQTYACPRITQAHQDCTVVGLRPV